MNNKPTTDNPKAPIPIFMQAGDGEFKPVKTTQGHQIWLCGECGHLHMFPDAHERAIACCKTRRCECGKELDTYNKQCRDCRDQEEMSKRKYITEEDYIARGLTEKTMVCDGSDFYSDLDEVYEQFEGEDAEDRPEDVCVAEPMAWDGLSVYDILANSVEEHHDDAMEEFADIEGLEAFVKEWSEKQKVTSYYESNTYVRLDWDGYFRRQVEQSLTSYCAKYFRWPEDIKKSNLAQLYNFMFGDKISQTLDLDVMRKDVAENTKLVANEQRYAEQSLMSYIDQLPNPILNLVDIWSRIAAETIDIKVKSAMDEPVTVVMDMNLDSNKHKPELAQDVDGSWTAVIPGVPVPFRQVKVTIGKHELEAVHLQLECESKDE